MKVYLSLNEFEKATNAVVTTGTFDGVHVGHQTIINRLKEIAQKKGGETVLLTFTPHPRIVLFPDDNDLKLLSTNEEKIELLKNYGIDHLIIHPFTREFSRITSDEYIRNILVSKIKTQTLVIGYNHQFGRNREGSFESLKELSHLYGFSVEEIPAYDVDQISVSSTKIRTALMEGNIEAANSFLGHPYTLSGEVIEGKKVGRTLGFPTANLKIKNKHKLIPHRGVYAVEILVHGEQFKGMCNIGTNPTLNRTEQQQVEVHIFNFDKNIYSQTVTLIFKERIRDEHKFPSKQELIAQLEKDQISALKVLS